MHGPIVRTRNGGKARGWLSFALSPPPLPPRVPGVCVWSKQVTRGAQMWGKQASKQRTAEGTEDPTPTNKKKKKWEGTGRNKRALFASLVVCVCECVFLLSFCTSVSSSLSTIRLRSVPLCLSPYLHHPCSTSLFHHITSPQCQSHRNKHMHPRHPRRHQEQRVCSLRPSIPTTPHNRPSSSLPLLERGHGGAAPS